MMIDTTIPFTLPETGRNPDSMTITMLRIYVGGLEQFTELLGKLPDTFFHLTSAEQERAYERMLLKARSTVGNIDLAELAEVGAEACR